MVKGPPKIKHVEKIYIGCLVGKQKRASFPHQTEYRADDLLEFFHGNICGPISPMTLDGDRYFILLVGDASQFMWLKVLATKDAASEAIKQYHAATEAETRSKLRTFHSDRGDEFNSTEFDEHYVEHGVRR
jgi:hypothetical protein